jgi:hypothetical protein
MERLARQKGESANSTRVAQGRFTSNSRENELANSPMMTAQRQKLQSLFGSAAQFKGPEEEPLQGKHPAGEEEFLPGKFGAQQHKSAEEESLQGKFDTVQRAEEEEKPLQGKVSTVQRVEEEEPLQKKLASTAPIQREKAPNNTGLPDNLKSGIESLSGVSMDNVKVHYNSSQPAQLNALAYAQGTDIHVAPGQEQHLPHEAWHVVQQARGRVKPTMQMKEGVPVNDDKALEHEADVMGAKAMAGLKPDTLAHDISGITQKMPSAHGKGCGCQSCVGQMQSAFPVLQAMQKTIFGENVAQMQGMHHSTPDVTVNAQPVNGALIQMKPKHYNNQSNWTSSYNTKCIASEGNNRYHGYNGQFYSEFLKKKLNSYLLDLFQQAKPYLVQGAKFHDYKSSEGWSNFNCAEFIALDVALDKGANPANLVFRTVDKNEKEKPACSNCSMWLSGGKIRSGFLGFLA